MHVRAADWPEEVGSVEPEAADLRGAVRAEVLVTVAAAMVGRREWVCPE